MQKGPGSGLPALFAAAMSHHRAGRWQEAERAYRQVLKSAPRHADALHFLGLLSHQTGRSERALELMDKAIAQNGRSPTFHHNRGVVLSEQGRHLEAAAAYRHAISHNAQFVEAHHNLGVSLQSLGSIDGAAAAYSHALELQPDFAAARSNLGIVRLEQGRLEEAASLLERALTLDPHQAPAHNALGSVRRLQGRFDDALAAYRRALDVDPKLVEAHDNVGLLLLERGAPREALPHFERALAVRADHAPALSHRGNALKELGETAAALASYGQAVRLAPDDPEARLGVAIATIPLVAADVAASMGALGSFEQALDQVAVWSDVHPVALGRSVGRNLPFYLAYRPGNVGPTLSRYGNLMSAASARQWPAAAVIAGVARPRIDRLQLSIVSGHVHRHPVWDVILRGLLAHLDRRRIHVTLYHTSATVDEETVRARGQVDRWVQGPQSMSGWLEDLARHPPDVLFFPEVGMDAVTWALASLRLAPVQVAAWGHPVTTGLPTIDRFVSGELLEGTRASTHYRETLLKLPGTGVCTTLPVGASLAWEGPPRSPGVVRFALCQQPIKFDPADDVLLARIALAVGACEFWLVRPAKLDWAVDRLCERLGVAFRALGLDPDRYLRVTPWLSSARFLGYLDDMDVYLDCPAFSGYTTAWQAVHRGVPIVTLEGEYLRQRLAAAILRRIGWPSGVAGTGDEYVDIATRLALDCRREPRAALDRRAAIRAAAPRVDDNREAIEVFERSLLNA